MSTAQVMRMIAASMPLAPWRGEGGPHLPDTAQQMLEVFNPDTISREPWTVIPTDLESICCG